VAVCREDGVTMDDRTGADEGACRTAIAVAQHLYGDLIERIVTHPSTGQVTVWLVGEVAEVIDADGSVLGPPDERKRWRLLRRHRLRASGLGPEDVGLVIYAVGAVLLFIVGMTHHLPPWLTPEVVQWLVAAVVGLALVLALVSHHRAMKRR